MVSERGIWHITDKDGNIMAMTTYKKYALVLCKALDLYDKKQHSSTSVKN